MGESISRTQTLIFAPTKKPFQKVRERTYLCVRTLLEVQPLRVQGGGTTLTRSRGWNFLPCTGLVPPGRENASGLGKTPARIRPVVPLGGTTAQVPVKVYPGPKCLQRLEISPLIYPFVPNGSLARKLAKNSPSLSQEHKNFISLDLPP
jgi:hypothetical protein